MNDPRLEIVSVDERGTTVLRVSGRLDARTAPQFLERSRAARAGGGNMVVNLSGVTFLGSSGVGALFALVQEVHEGNGIVRVAAPSREVTTVIQLLNLERFLPVHSSEEEALASLGS